MLAPWSTLAAVEQFDPVEFTVVNAFEITISADRPVDWNGKRCPALFPVRPSARMDSWRHGPIFIDESENRDPALAAKP